MHHAEAALRVGNILAAGTADLAAHVTIHHAAHQRHLAHVVHPGADEELADAGRGGGEKALDLFGQMLAVAVEDHHVGSAMLQPVTKAALDRFSFAAVLFVNNHVGAGVFRLFRCPIR